MEDNDKNKKVNLIGLVASMIKIGCIGFGGGNALIPVIHKEIVEDRKLLSEDEFNEDVLIANLTPGALPVEVAGGIGSRLFGYKGMLACAAGMALPGYLLTVCLICLYNNISDTFLSQVSYITVGVSAFICCILINYIYNSAKLSLNKDGSMQKMLAIILMLIVFIVTSEKSLYRLIGVEKDVVLGYSSIDVFFVALFAIIIYSSLKNKVNRIIFGTIGIGYAIVRSSAIRADFSKLAYIIRFVMIATIAFCLIKEFYNYKKNNIESLMLERGKREKELFVIALIIVALFTVALLVDKKYADFTLKGFISSIISFGGGDAYLTVADGMFVNSGLISENDFYGILVPSVNVLPGSILCKTLSGVGYFIGSSSSESFFAGLFVSIIGFFISVLASCGVFTLIYSFYDRCRQLTLFANLQKGIRIIVSGLMATICVSLLNQCSNVNSGTMKGWSLLLSIGLICGGTVLLNKKVNKVIVLLVLIVLAVLTLNLI